VAITRIPEPYRPGLAKIKNLSQPEVDTLVRALGQCPLRGGLKGIISAASELIPALKPDDVEDMVKALYSLYVYRGDSSTPLATFVPQLVTAMRSSGKDLVISEEDKSAFQERITKLLSINALGLASKADVLRGDYPNTFHDAKILTDIRPLFAEPNEKPLGAVITHTFKIEYHREGHHKVFYVALDANDLETVLRIVQRAEKKAATLQALLQSTSLSDLSEEKA